MKIKLIICDLDGTLVDSSIDIANALNHALAPYEAGPLSVEQTKSLVGEGLTRLVEKVLSPDRLGVRDAVLDRFIEYYAAHLTDFTRPYPGVAETLGKLQGYRKSVVSNKREDLSKKILDDLGLLTYFDIVLGSDSVSEKKPSPLPLLKVLDLLAMKPEEAVIVGDSSFDIQAGKAAGVKTIAVSYGFRDASLLQDADIIIDRFDAMISVLDRMNNG